MGETGRVRQVRFDFKAAHQRQLYESDPTKGRMMRYMLLIHASEQEEAAMAPEAMGEMMAEYGRFSEALAESGAMVGGDRLRPTTEATTLRIRDGKDHLLDGPFAETKEQFGGYYMIDVENLDQAIEWAKRIPSAKMGSVEIRPIWEMEDPQ